MVCSWILRSFSLMVLFVSRDLMSWKSGIFLKSRALAKVSLMFLMRWSRTLALAISLTVGFSGAFFRSLVRRLMRRLSSLADRHISFRSALTYANLTKTELSIFARSCFSRWISLSEFEVLRSMPTR